MGPDLGPEERINQKLHAGIIMPAKLCIAAHAFFLAHGICKPG